MSHHYTNYSKPNNKVEENNTVIPEASNAINDPVVAAVDDEVSAHDDLNAKKAAEVFGKIIDCKKLRVRSEGNSNAEVICDIAEGTLVMVDEEESTNEFYKVCTENGIEGFCMKKYITLEQ